MHVKFTYRDLTIECEVYRGKGGDDPSLCEDIVVRTAKDELLPGWVQELIIENCYEGISVEAFKQ